jgi:hypothetical protein
MNNILQSSSSPYTSEPSFQGILPKIVPWTGLDEWRFVKDALFSIPYNTEDFSFALELGEVWRLRGKLPVSVDATLSLKRLQMVLISSENFDPVILQLALSAALLRMVNELTDPGQRGQYAQPLNRLAENIGLPRILVDIRHEATHDSLPSLPTLELGLEIALDYLYTNYWEPFAQSTMPNALRNQIEKSLDQIAALNISDLDSSTRTAQKILTSEIRHLEASREKQTMLASVLLTQKWIADSKIFKLIEPCLIRLDCFTSFTIEFILASMINETLITSTILERVKELVGHASFIPEKGAISRVLHSLMFHISHPVLSITNILFDSPEVKRHCLDLTALYQQVASSFSGNNIAPSVSSSQLELVLNKIGVDQTTPTSVKPGYINDWKPVPFGCCPGYDPIKDGFYKQCYPNLLNR